MLTLKKSIYKFAAIGALLFAAGCAQENDMPDNPAISGRGRFSIRAASPSSLSTRADGTPMDAAENEKISDWWMVITTTNGTVVKKICRNAPGYPGFEAVVNNTDAVEAERFECDLEAGVYNVYAFANITPQQVQEATNIDFTAAKIDPKTPDNETPSSWSHGSDSVKPGTGNPEGEGGEYRPDDAEASATAGSETGNLNLWKPGTPIPMSGYLKGVKVTNSMEEAFAVEVVRMVAKVEFGFSNAGTTSVSVNSISLDPVTVSPVSLFPQYDKLGESAFTPLVNPAYGRLLLGAAPNSSLVTLPMPDNVYEIPENLPVKNYSFYMKESLSNTPNRIFTVTLNLSRTDRKGNVVSQEEVRYTTTNKITEYINRNDWIYIPIRLTDWIVDYEVLFYPPIGGYPAKEVYKESDSRSYYITFGTPGKFVITPKIRNTLSQTLLAPDEYKDLKITEVSDPDDIISKAPVYNPKDGEIIGEVSGNTGKATLNVSFVRDDVTYNRTIVIIRKTV